MKIEIGFDSCGNQAEQFADWLNQRGHTAHVGNSTGSYVDGLPTSGDEDANDILRELWDRYCKEG